MQKLTATLALLSLAACLCGCLPSGDSGGDAIPSPRDSSSDADASQLGFPGDPCAKDVECARLLVCDSGRCAVVPCLSHADCGDDADPSNQRGCRLAEGRCTAQECVTAAGMTCAEHFGLPGECDGRVCQE